LPTVYAHPGTKDTFDFYGNEIFDGIHDWITMDIRSKMGRKIWHNLEWNLITVLLLPKYQKVACSVYDQLQYERTGILNPIEVVVIDDTLVGIEAAKNAGVDSISLRSGCRATGITCYQNNRMKASTIWVRLQCWIVSQTFLFCCDKSRTNHTLFFLARRHSMTTTETKLNEPLRLVNLALDHTSVLPTWEKNMTNRNGKILRIYSTSIGVILCFILFSYRF